MNPFTRFINYLRVSKIELEKVAWPSRQDVIRYSSLIVVVSLVAAIFFAALDTGLQSVIQAIISRKNVAPIADTSTTPVIPADSLTATPEETAATNAPDTTNVITGSPITTSTR